MPVLLLMLLAQTPIADGGRFTPEALVAVDGGWVLAYSREEHPNHDDEQFLARLDAKGTVVSTRRLSDAEGLSLAGSGEAFGITYVTHTQQASPYTRAWMQVIDADGEPKAKAVAVIDDPLQSGAPIAWNRHTRSWATAYAAPGGPERKVVTKLARISEMGEDRGVTEVSSTYGIVWDLAASGEGFVVLVGLPLRLIEWNGSRVGKVTPIAGDFTGAVLAREGRSVLTFDRRGVLALHAVEKGAVKTTVLTERRPALYPAGLSVLGQQLLWWEGADMDHGRLWAASFDGVKLGKPVRFDAAEQAQLRPVVAGGAVVWARGNYLKEPTGLWFSAAP